MGLMDEHYFLIEKNKPDISMVENYEDVKDIKNCNNIIKQINGVYTREITDLSIASML